jgi:phage-related protein
VNGRVAKKIRKMVYGEGSRRVQEYGIIERAKSYFVTEDGKRKEKKLITGQLVCRGLREKYKAMKKAYRRGELVLHG